MGNTLGSIQKSLADNETKDARELLDRLEDMAENRIELFYDKIGYAYLLHRYAQRRSDLRHPCRHDETDRHIIPIKKVLNKYYQRRVLTGWFLTGWFLAGWFLARWFPARRSRRLGRS